MVQAYWNIGKRIVEEEQKGGERAAYGTETLKNLSKKLTSEYGKGFTISNLQYMRQFYLVFPIHHALRGELSWTHYRLLLKVKNEKARNFYMEEAVVCNWSTRSLERQIHSLYYERMLMSTKKGRPLVKEEAARKSIAIQPKDLWKDPYILEFLDLKKNPTLYEEDLEQAIIDKLQEFLLELGKGFSFVARQYRISAGIKHFHADLVFYNYLLKCFVIIDLKTTELTHQDIGQMDMYVRYFEAKVRQKDDNPSLGLILCAEKNNFIAKYSLLEDSKQIFASKYQTYLPSVKELEREIERERDLVEQERKLGE